MLLSIFDCNIVAWLWISKKRLHENWNYSSGALSWLWKWADPYYWFSTAVYPEKPKKSEFIILIYQYWHQKILIPLTQSYSIDSTHLAYFLKLNKGSFSFHRTLSILRVSRPGSKLDFFFRYIAQLIQVSLTFSKLPCQNFKVLSILAVVIAIMYKIKPHEGCLTPRFTFLH